MVTNYRIIEVDIENGYIKLDITYFDDTEETVCFHLSQIVTSDDATEIQIKCALDQMVQQRAQSLIPAPTPAPKAALNLLGKSFSV